VSMSSRRAQVVLDGFGAVLLLLFVGVTAVAARTGGTPGPEIALILGVAAALVVGRLLGPLHRAIVPAVAAASGAVAVGSGPLIGGGPLDGPFGYRNATGAFCVLATIASLMVAAAAPRSWMRIPSILAAAAFAIVAAVDSTAAGLSVLVVILFALLGLFGPRGVRISIVAVATLFAVVFAGTILLGAAYRPGLDTVLTRTLTERRLVLWHEALQIVAAHPGGVGPDRFSDVSRTARQDPDARWAHNEFLQHGVELGVGGLVILVLIILWGFARLWVHPSPDMVVGLAAAALAALCIHACVDYVLHFPAVPLAAAALVGTAQALPFRRSIRHDHDDSRQEGFESDGHPTRVAGAPSRG
jgi:O-antigen ligase